MVDGIEHCSVTPSPTRIIRPPPLPAQSRLPLPPLNLKNNTASATNPDALFQKFHKNGNWNNGGTKGADMPARDENYQAFNQNS